MSAYGNIARVRRLSIAGRDSVCEQPVSWAPLQMHLAQTTPNQKVRWLSVSL